MNETIYGTLRIYGILKFKPVVRNEKDTEKPVLLETCYGLTLAQARGMMADFRGQNADIFEDFIGKWTAGETL